MDPVLIKPVEEIKQKVNLEPEVHSKESVRIESVIETKPELSSKPEVQNMDPKINIKLNKSKKIKIKEKSQKGEEKKEVCVKMEEISGEKASVKSIAKLIFLSATVIFLL